MPRYARPHIPGALMHVVTRFNNGEYLLDVEDAREHYRQCLADALASHDTTLHAYGLMSSHAHLVLRLGTKPLAPFMRAVNSRWAWWLNRRLGRKGHVTAARPWSALCDTERYLLTLVRYVHNNPVRASLVRHAADSTWTSHRAYLGIDEAPAWLDIESVLMTLAGDISEARAILGQIVDGARTEPRRPELSGEVPRALAKRIRSTVGGPVEISYPILGPDEFVRKAYQRESAGARALSEVRSIPISATDVLAAVCRTLGLDPPLVLGYSRAHRYARARRLVAWICCELLGRQHVEVAQLLGVRRNTVTMMLRSMRSGRQARVEQITIRRIVDRIRQAAIRQLESAGSMPAATDGSSASHPLLLRLRDIDAKLSASAIRPATCNGAKDADSRNTM